MGLKDMKSRKAVYRAIIECDELGRDEFLRKYGFGTAKAYYLFDEGIYYDSKAIIGVAHGYEFPEKGPLHSFDFCGGEATVMPKLIKLGFDVVVK
jgi:hypothetical protein